MTIPASWTPQAAMHRIICHWTAGADTASPLDRQHYHFIVEGDGNLVRGDRSVADNAAPIRGAYAAHTLRCNTGSIGVSMACMAGAKERPFFAGYYPMTAVQWGAFVEMVAMLCRRYRIEVTPQTVLSHAEVQGTLGIQQRGKWDFTRLPVDPGVVGAKAVGDKMRREVKEAIARLEAGGPAPQEPGEGEVLKIAAGAMEMRGVVTAGWLNFRRSPDGEKIGSLPRGTAVAIVDREGAWYQVRSPAGYLGWVHGGYVAIE